MWPRFKNWKWLVPVVLIVVGIICWQFSQTLTNQKTIVSFFDVGQGDSILIQAPGGREVLIDGGPDRSVLTHLGETLPWYDHSIDVIILTHPHTDHLNGLIAVIDRYQVGAVIEAGVDYESVAYDTWHERLQAKNIPIVRAQAGEQINFSSATVLTILTPFNDWQNHAPKNVHEAQVVTRLTVGNENFLFTGDMEGKLEAQLLASAEPITASVLKVGHHGSKTSTAPAFVTKVQPQFAVISVGAKNRYGHPTAQTLNTLTKAGVSILQTDLDGTITFVTDGNNLVRN